MRLSQIVNNLINNAYKIYTAEGFVSFKIESETLANQRASLLTVTDSGVGIAEDKISSILILSQNSIDNTRKFGGLGLGLYSIKP
jgi:signal transduction histidine kinase